MGVLANQAGLFLKSNAESEGGVKRYQEVTALLEDSLFLSLGEFFAV